jgi:hypothetical protein
MIRANFTAELYTRFGRVGVSDTSVDYLGPLAINSAKHEGWLCTEAGLNLPNPILEFFPLRFHFQYVKEEPSRTYYFISGTDSVAYSGSRLEQSKNGWLGMYGTHLVGRVTDALNPANLLDNFSDKHLWKIETLQEWDGEVASARGIEFYLRDSQGHRVAQVAECAHSYLHAGDLDGEILKFQLHNIRLE